MGKISEKKARLYGSAVYQLKTQGNNWPEVAKTTGLSERSAQRYYAEYQKELKSDPNLSKAVQAATDKMLELTEGASKRYAGWINDENTAPQAQKLAFDASTNVLKSAKALTDRHVIERDLSNKSDDELFDAAEQLLEQRRRTRTATDGSGDEAPSA